jgi:hypothetical protein
MKATRIIAGTLLGVLAACTSPEQQSEKMLPSDLAQACEKRFWNGKIEKLLDRLVQYESEDALVGVELSYDLEFDDRPPKEFERLLGVIAPSEQLTVSFDKGRWLVHVERSNVVVRTGATLANDLKKICAVAARERMDLVTWRYKLPDNVHLETGNLYPRPVE